MPSGSGVAAEGTRVQVRSVVLEPADRAAGLPEDTARVPYESRVRGRLTAPGRVGEPVTVRTAVGRALSGVLELVEPADLHTFGRPPAALVEAVAPMAALLEELS
jgi:2-amino-4-ketopentanoate thiolase alpha subunit